VASGRVEAFSDGVFAIAITLLILTVTPPTHGELGHELLRLWPSYVAYAVSFLTIGIIWVNHHAIFRLFAGVDRTMLFLNVFFLMVVAFIPFPTEVVADNVRDPGSRKAAALLYGCNMILLAIGFVVLWVYGSGRLLREDSDRREVAGITRSFIPGIPVYAAGTLLAFVSPIASLVVFAALAGFFVLSSSLFARHIE
jgi:TMEM175 potassium channel family protein